MILGTVLPATIRSGQNPLLKCPNRIAVLAQTTKPPEKTPYKHSVFSDSPASRITPVIDVVCGGLFLSQVALLDPLVAQQVAAGEVVDRPASVVKELSENALDAGATRVEVEISDGGHERMLVRDNGSGMSDEAAKLSVLSHATSKIRTATDIESVMTLGFR